MLALSFLPQLPRIFGLEVAQRLRDAGLLSAALAFVSVAVVGFLVSGLWWLVAEVRSGYREPVR